jgi:DNA modification methylase
MLLVGDCRERMAALEPNSIDSIVTDPPSTVKPIDVMRWLVRMVTPPGGVVLDPFTGSGTTGVATIAEGFRFIGIEREAEYATIAEARIVAACAQVSLFTEGA